MPPKLIQQLQVGLDDLRDNGGPLFRETRNEVWTDIIDPELCMNKSKPTPPDDDDDDSDSPGLASWRIRSRDFEEDDDDDEPDTQRIWQAATAIADQEGRVRWVSWVNHLSHEQHRPVLDGLAELVALALPHWEAILGGERLQGKPLQIVVGAYEHRLPEGKEEEESFGISDWHVDGTIEENIVATATSYIDFGAGVVGGEVEFASSAEDMREEEPEERHTVRPETGSMLAFSNIGLRHRVQPVSGRGRRLLVALHLVDPTWPQEPRCEDLPRLFDLDAKRESLRWVLILRAPCIQYPAPWLAPSLWLPLSPSPSLFSSCFRSPSSNSNRFERCVHTITRLSLTGSSPTPSAPASPTSLPSPRGSTSTSGPMLGLGRARQSLLAVGTRAGGRGYTRGGVCDIGDAQAYGSQTRGPSSEARGSRGTRPCRAGRLSSAMQNPQWHLALCLDESSQLVTRQQKVLGESGSCIRKQTRWHRALSAKMRALFSLALRLPVQGQPRGAIRVDQTYIIHQHAVRSWSRTQ